MLKVTAISLLMVLSLASASSLQISEVELNPAGSDTGAEWVEIYSEESVNLGDFALVVRAGTSTKEYPLEGDCEGYCVIQKQSQWLVNSDQTVRLITGGEIIDQTDSLEDSSNDDQTWNFCDGSWEQAPASKGESNGCGELVDESRESEESATSSAARKKIVLTSSKSTESATTVTGYGHVAFNFQFIFASACLVIALLVIWKKL